MIVLFKKTVLLALITALGVAGLLFASASAARQGQISNEKLEKVWGVKGDFLITLSLCDALKSSKLSA